MALSIDGTPANGNSTPGGTTFSVGPVTSSFGNGIVVLDILANDASLFVSSISGGSLTWSRHSSINGGAGYLERWSAQVGNTALSSQSFTVTATTSGVFISWGLYVVSSAGSTVNFDSGGPQTGTSSFASMTTNETALVTFCARFGTDNAPTVTSPWSGIVSGVANSFFCAGHQDNVAAGTYTGASSGTSQNASIIDGFFTSAASSVVFRKTLSSLGGRVGSRQAWGD